MHRVISTHTWGTGLDFPHLGAVIRADGGSGKIDNTQLSGRVTRPSDGKQIGVIVDFDDVNNRRLSARAKKRMGSYRGKGWKITSLRLS
jgi:superfamily II DNA or RNA helicase